MHVWAGYRIAMFVISYKAGDQAERFSLYQDDLWKEEDYGFIDAFIYVYVFLFLF